MAIYPVLKLILVSEHDLDIVPQPAGSSELAHYMKIQHAGLYSECVCHVSARSHSDLAGKQVLGSRDEHGSGRCEKGCR